MNKTGSMATLLIIALLALGVMAFVSFGSDPTGALSPPSRSGSFPEPGPGPSQEPQFPIVRPVIDRDVTVYDKYDYDGGGCCPWSRKDSKDMLLQIQEDIVLQCHIFNFEHPGKATQAIGEICVRHGVNV